MKSAPYLNPNPYCQFIGPKNLGKALIDGELMTCLLDNKAQINFVTPTYAHKWGMDIMSLDHLAQEIGGQIPPIASIRGIMVESEGFVMMNVQIPCIKELQGSFSSLPGFSTNYARFFCCKGLVFLCTNLCKVLWSKLCLDPVFQVMCCMTFGECCEMVREFFVRVLHSSRVDLIM